MNELVQSKNDIVEYDEEGNAVLAFDKDVHLVVNGDFLISTRGEIGIVSKTLISLDCALLCFNSAVSKQIRQMKSDLRAQFIEMLGIMPNITEDQKKYLKVLKNRVTELLEIDNSEITHLEE